MVLGTTDTSNYTTDNDKTCDHIWLTILLGNAPLNTLETIHKIGKHHSCCIQKMLAKCEECKKTISRGKISQWTVFMQLTPSNHIATAWQPYITPHCDGGEFCTCKHHVLFIKCKHVEINKAMSTDQNIPVDMHI